VGLSALHEEIREDNRRRETGPRAASLDLTPYKDEKDFGVLRRLVRKAA
jgi:hypothetical protein